ncbi:MAG: FAD-dependent oxidoreductase [Bacteroidetes bacterium]|nr:FAD-dependent oxidoreductase [Bacteroidota bacterium]
MRIAIIGAGAAGMTAAYELSKELGGKVSELDVYEKSDSVGGLSKSISLWGQRLDLGPHRFFSHDSSINELWLEVVKERYEIVDRQTRIYYKSRFFDYPIKAINALRGLGVFEAARCVISYMAVRVSPPKDTSTFEGWVISRFGNRLYSIFFKTYSERLWGIPCTELDSDFASQRIKKLSLLETIKNAIFQGQGGQHATLVDQFAYPVGGTGAVYESMRLFVESKGGKVMTGTGVEKIITVQGRVSSVQLESGEVFEYDHVISTMPLTQMVERLPGVPADILKLTGTLRFRNTILVYLKVDRTDLFTDQWLYIHDQSVTFGRVTNFRNWIPSVYGDSESSVLCMEYWCNFEDELWSREAEKVILKAKEEIVRAGLVPEGQEMEGEMVRLPRCYPVYFSRYREALAPVEEYLETIGGLHVIGRYGAYKYNNQDHSILMGMRVAANITRQAAHNLWEINTDYEVYQESSVITKTGLVKKPVS